MIEQLEKKAKEIRLKVLDISEKAKTGHLTSSFSCTEILVALYYGNVLKFDSSKPEDPKRDRFILSKGQASLILYPILADLGFFPKKNLEGFCDINGKFGVHLQHDVPGVEITSGSLGIGFGIAAGMATALQGKDQKVYTLLGDGECYEGSIWETAMYASQHKLNNLIAIIDRNRMCATDFTEKILTLEPMEKKWEAFGWNVVRIDGHSFEEIFSAIDAAKSNTTGKPFLIIADTIKGKGIPFIYDQPLRHGTALVGEEAAKARRELEEKS